MRFSTAIFFVIFVVAICGCASLKNDATFAHATSQMGRAKIQNNDTTTIFDAAFAKSEQGDVMIALYKGLPPAIATVKLFPDGIASFQGFGKSWWGPRWCAPAAMSPLLEVASLYVTESALPNGKHTILTSNTRIETNVTKGRIQSAVVTNSDGLHKAEIQF